MSSAMLTTTSLGEKSDAADRSMTRPAANSVSSSNGLPISCSPSGSPPGILAGRHGDARQARHVHRHREHVVEVHLHRIGAHVLVAHAERRARRRRRQDGVDAIGEDHLEVALDQRAHLLRPHVIGVVVAGRQHIGADHQPPPHFRAEPLGAGQFVHVGDVLAGDPQPVLHAVIAREVGRRFGRRHDVVGRQRVLGVRQRDVLDRRRLRP